MASVPPLPARPPRSSNRRPPSSETLATERASGPLIPGGPTLRQRSSPRRHHRPHPGRRHREQLPSSTVLSDDRSRGELRQKKAAFGSKRPRTRSSASTRPSKRALDQ